MTKWPLHITLASNFVTDKTVPELNELMMSFCDKHSAVIATVGGDDYFGPEGQIHVTKLEMNPELMSLHTALIDTLKASGAVFDDPQYIEEGYVAHATVWYDKRLNKGGRVSIKDLSLVDMFADNDIRERKILTTISLQ